MNKIYGSEYVSEARTNSFCRIYVCKRKLGMRSTGTNWWLYEKCHNGSAVDLIEISQN